MISINKAGRELSDCIFQIIYTLYFVSYDSLTKWKDVKQVDDSVYVNFYFIFI